jgi:hypothetical protein
MELLGACTPMGPPENPTDKAKNQGPGRRKRPIRRPRMRRCLLKGCEQWFHPRRARQRYCSAECRQAARQWSRWKAQQSYRATAVGKEKRNGQSRRYRERLRNRKQSPPQEVVAETARVITKEFFRPLLRSSGLLRQIPSTATVAPAALLFACLPACSGTSSQARRALAPGCATVV